MTKIVGKYLPQKDLLCFRRIMIVVKYCSFFIIDFFGFFVTDQKKCSTDEEDGSAPTDPIGPTEVPKRTIGRN